MIRIDRLCRVVGSLERSVRFYEEVLGFRGVWRGPADLRGVGEGEAEEAILELGEERVGLVAFRRAGPAYPRGSRSNDLWFQHAAVVVSDLPAAVAQVRGAGAEAISVGGLQVLPPRNGRVGAWKFRDPDGHPLELLWFPAGQGRAVWRRRPGLFMGLDHSALGCSDTVRSWRFWRGVGFRVAEKSWNAGVAQSRLDAVPGARVRVSGLRPDGAGMGLELLAYHPPGRAMPDVGVSARLTDWVVVETGALRTGARQGVRDPDGHRAVLVGVG